MNEDVVVAEHESPDTSVAALTNIGHLIEKLPQRISIERDFGACDVVVAPSGSSRGQGVVAVVGITAGLAAAVTFGDVFAIGMAVVYLLPLLHFALASSLSSLRVELGREGVHMRHRPVPMIGGGWFDRRRIASVEVRPGGNVVLVLKGPVGAKVVAAGLDPEQALAFSEVLNTELARLESQGRRR